jgi:hypothetical protein
MLVANCKSQVKRRKMRGPRDGRAWMSASNRILLNQNPPACGGEPATCNLQPATIF